ncbi:Uncharacterised protein [Kingella negevensis]|uniref:Uncharacterized protein n=1 Tax=Kingella negevensis TaxID=1522312 RepID=A0A238HKG8_9NEIS|nr:Uncharacterised protein [Kingella negevensis]
MVIGGVLQAFYVEIGGAYGDAFTCYLCAFNVGIATAHDDGGAVGTSNMTVAIGSLFAIGMTFAFIASCGKAE